jgi:hypothetical protein
MTSIVLPDCKTEFRAQIIEKWINIAKVFFNKDFSLKNFSGVTFIK